MLQVPAGNGGIAAVITEDSDLVTYGCPYVIFKADRSGHGQQLALADLFGPPPSADQNATPGEGSSSGGCNNGTGKPASFRRFSLEMLQTVCVLAGCDFLPSVKGEHLAFLVKYNCNCFQRMLCAHATDCLLNYQLASVLAALQEPSSAPKRPTQLNSMSMQHACQLHDGNARHAKRLLIARRDIMFKSWPFCPGSPLCSICF